MKNPFIKNCCDGIYNSIDVHFTSACDNKCKHCIDMRFNGMGVNKPDPMAIINAIYKTGKNFDDILFLGGEPCLFMDELLECVEKLRYETRLKLFVTTSVPKTCLSDKFIKLLSLLDGINLSVQHYDENIADEIRGTKSKFDRQEFYKSLPMKDKIRINLNIVKPYLYTKKDLTKCLMHYDSMGFNSIKLSEIQHGKEHFISFENVFGINLGSAYSKGCQTYLDTSNLFPGMRTPLLLKRSCFACEETLKASFMDGLKSVYKLFHKPKNNYAVIYGNGTLTNGWR